MEANRPENQDSPTPPISNVTMSFLAVVVTADVCFAIATHWKNYDWLGRFLGIVLMLNLGMGLFAVFEKGREGKKNRPVSLALLVYSSLLLATILFNR